MATAQHGENKLTIDSRAAAPFYKNGYLVASPDSDEVVYIDPGDEVTTMLELIATRQFQLAAILLTHAHMDHISGISQVREQHDALIYLHPEDRGLYESLPAQAQMFGFQCGPAPPVDRELSDHQVLELAGVEFKVHFTPGHSPGHVCFEAGQHIFCGDVVFQGSVGRTDLPGGSSEVLLSSIQERVLPLGDERILYPGHGPQTTIGRERRTNPFLVGMA